MKRFARNGRIARLITATAVAVPVALAFVALGGVGLAHSAIRFDQYGLLRHIGIVKASAASTGVVTLRVEIIGWKMYPTLVGKIPNKSDGGHWAIVVDGRFNKASANSTVGRTRPLQKGVHRIYALLANNDGSYLSPPVKSNTVRVRVTHTTAKKVNPPAL